ncbi:MAG TPA: hypothetical protein VK174_11695 [Chitinophagales bacterium]|nr:hypothetical protein [Chitinophagales bacterium]
MKTAIYFSFFLLFAIMGCKRTAKKYKTLQTFTIADYEFEIEQVTEIDKWSGKVKRTYIDTSLMNLCDFCHDCEDSNDEPFSSRR